jgi:Mn2+/Fe2+ NRAMP family transporter
MIVMMLITTNKEITGGVKLPNLQKTVGWIVTGVMFAVAACLMVTLL